MKPQHGSHLQENRRAIGNPDSAGKQQETVPPPKDKYASGVALVIVLAFLVLITALVIAFFSNVSTELSGARGYAGGASAKQLADSAVQVVMGAIRQGTTKGANVAWASQPGMIRTYGTYLGSGSYAAGGTPLACYKLYSSDNMVVTSLPFDPSTDVASDWNTKPALFTDLNSPVASGTSMIFPILDGNGIQKLTKTASMTTTGTYLGYSAVPAKGPDIAGFSIDPNSPVLKYSGTAAPLSGTNTPVPMPVKWLYVLKDGSLTAPTGVDSTGKIANWTTSTGIIPTSQNPIVGRVAFWTDDETCKVNINTASEGTYCDMARVCTNQELSMAKTLPMQHEYQRYPGHPAMTSLSTIFNSGTSLNLAASGTAQNELIYGIAPRVGGGGSRSGTALTSKYATAGATPTPTPPPVIPKSDRLFASIDELMFKPLVTGSTRDLNDPNSPNPTVITKAKLQQAKFFITTSSRAPDLNLFGKPRVCIWPIHTTNDANHRTTFDQLIAWCSTVNAYPFFFQRQLAKSPTNDLPPSPSNSGLGRNRTVLEYLRKMTSGTIPGFGGNFQSKYSTQNPNGGTDCDQILTEIFDYIRSANLTDLSIGGTNGVNPNFVPFTPLPSVPSSGPGAGTVQYLSDAAGLAGQKGGGIVCPIEDTTNGTRGFGRFPTVQQAFIHFIGGDKNDAVTLGGTVPPNYTRVRAAFCVQLNCLSPGYVVAAPYYSVKVSNLNNFGWATNAGALTSMNFPTSGTISWCNFIQNNENYVGGLMGYTEMCRNFLYSPNAYPFVTTGTTAGTSFLDVPTADGSFQFKGGNVDIEILEGGTSVQKVTLNFPTATFPLPVPVTPQTYTNGSVGPTYARQFLGSSYVIPGGTYGDGSVIPGGTYRGRFGDDGWRWWDPNYWGPGVGGWVATGGYIMTGTAGGYSGIALTAGSDVVRAVLATPGDLRVIAPRKTIVPSDNLFAPHPNYTLSGTMMAHNVWNGEDSAMPGATSGQLVNGLAYYSGNKADSPPSINGIMVGSTNSATSTTDMPGDFDQAFGPLRDGGYINKPDEGSLGGAKDPNNGPEIPYFPAWSHWLDRPVGATLFSPNRQMISAVMFGSLPTGVWANKPWQTLLFRPCPPGHPGNGQPTQPPLAGQAPQPPYTVPPDHLLLDLFSMPIVEPYAISEPLSTAGRINMNYQIAPFSYITRSTGVQAVLKSEQIYGVFDNDVYTGSPNWAGYKTGVKLTGTTTTTVDSYQHRTALNVDETLKGFQQRFATNDIFRSPSEICDIALVPSATTTPSTTAPTYANMMNGTFSASYWANKRLTGDNTKERPYAEVYPRFTTKSNTFTVHMRVQTLKKVPGSTAASWVENKDVVVSEYRGSQTIERYVDADDPTLPDFAQVANLNYSLESYPDLSGSGMTSAYKFRVITTKKFTP